MGLGLGIGISLGRGGSLGGWLPTQLSSCAVWLPGSSIAGIADGGAVTTWPDASGNGRSPTQATGTKRPLYRATGGPNSKPCVEFDGTDDYLRVAYTLAQPIHAFVVGKFLRVGGGSDTMMDGGVTNGLRLASFDATRCYAQTAALLLLTATPTNWNRFEIQYNGASGSLLANEGAAVTGNIGGTSSGGLCLGILGDEASGPAQCQIAEVILFSGILGATDLANARAYLRTKYT